MPIKVGFVGVGRIGTIMASNILKAKHELIVYDVRKEATDNMAKQGARIAASPREVAEFADIIEIAVRDDAQVLNAVTGDNGILKGAKRGSVIAIHRKKALASWMLR
jgi:3-hydroxyisobutyrate dehydrogenase-like beta-hydroxyacid dehydrogenase